MKPHSTAQGGVHWLTLGTMSLDSDEPMRPPAPADQPGSDEWLARLGSLPLMAQPGETFLYDTADFATFLDQNLLTPLAMRDTSFSVPPAKVHRFVSAYSMEAGELELTDGPRTGQWSKEPAFASGAGGLGTYWMTDPSRNPVAIAMTQVALTSPDSTRLIDDFSEAVLGG